MGYRDRADLPRRLRPRLARSGPNAVRPSALHDLVFRCQWPARPLLHLRRDPEEVWLSGGHSRLADRLDGLLAVDATLPSARHDRPAPPPPGRAPNLDRNRRRHRGIAVLPGADPELGWQTLRLVRSSARAYRLGVRAGHDLARLRRLLPGLGRMARDPGADPGGA